MKLLITGAGGLLGTDVTAVARSHDHEVVPLGHGDLDVTDRSAVDSTLAAARPEAVVHCAAYTNVDAAEVNEDLAMALNRDATGYVAEAASQIGARFVYVSSDYVFDGARAYPYEPDSATSPVSVYGTSKLAGERVALETAPGAIVARTGWLFGRARSNFVTAMVRRAASGETLTVVDDQVGGPTWAHDVAEALVGLIEHGVEGIWHVADRGACSWADLAREALRLRGLDTEVVGVSADAWGAPAPRPRYSVLDVSATERQLGRTMPEWRDSLSRFLADPASPAG